MQKPPLAKREEHATPSQRQTQRQVQSSKDFIVQNGMLKPRKQSSSARASRASSAHQSVEFGQLLQPNSNYAKLSSGRRTSQNAADLGAVGGSNFTTGNLMNVTQVTPRQVSRRSRPSSTLRSGLQPQPGSSHNSHSYSQGLMQQQPSKAQGSTNKGSSGSGPRQLSLKQLMGVAGTGNGGGGGTYFTSGRS